MMMFEHSQLIAELENLGMLKSATLCQHLESKAVSQAQWQLFLDMLPRCCDLNISDTTFGGAILAVQNDDAFQRFSKILDQSIIQVAKIFQELQTLPKPKVAQAERFIKLWSFVAQQTEVLSLDLVQRTTQFLQIDPTSEQAQEQGQGVLAIEAKLAGRLGISSIKSELEDFALRCIDPESYYFIKDNVALKRKERERVIEQMTQELNQLMESSKIIAEVCGRYKRFYSIYKKLQRVNFQFERIQDLFAFRVLTHSINDCYRALDVIHQRWQSVEGRSKDYIMKSKKNGYSSLHTTLVDEFGMYLEVQIRTVEMHHTAEYGPAAHWLYKEANPVHADKKTLNKLQSSQELLQHAMRQKEQPQSSKKRKRKVSEENETLVPIYVRTPDEDIFELPHDATPVDLAYAIHSKLGELVTGAQINGKQCSIFQPLQTNQCVKLILSENQTPHLGWLAKVRSKNAKKQIEKYLRASNQEQVNEVIQQSLEFALKARHLEWKKVSKEQIFLDFLHVQGYKSVSELIGKIREASYRNVALDVQTQQFVSLFISWSREQMRVTVEETLMKSGVDLEHLKKQALLNQFLQTSGLASSYNDLLDQIIQKKTLICDVVSKINHFLNLRNQVPEGFGNSNLKRSVVLGGNMPTQAVFAKCCYPYPHAPITGYLLGNGGLSVHRSHCSQLSLLDSKRMIEVQWS